MVFTDNNGSSAGAHESDDISLFLRQLLHRSSSSSLSSTLSAAALAAPSSTPPVRPHAPDHHQLLPCFSSVPISTTNSLLHQHIPGPSAVFSGSNRLVVDRISDDSLSGVVLSPSGYFPATGGSNLSSESLTGSVQMRCLDNDYADDCDCESEEGPEAVAEEGETKQPPSRSQSKRSRAAEVHNLSEKRRRSRINEKMKALQNLIPNSNKTDKASMLDEAIEYLKQLQLQVQMLSMRNGLTLHPLCLPGVPGVVHPEQLSQMGMDFGSRDEFLDINMANTLSMLPSTSHSVINLPNQCGSSARPSLSSVSTAINSEGAFGMESRTQASFGPFQLSNSRQAICREPSAPQERLIAKNAESKPLGSDVKGRSLVEVCAQQKEGPPEMLPENISGQDQLARSNFSGLYATTSAENEQLTIRR